MEGEHEPDGAKPVKRFENMASLPALPMGAFWVGGMVL